MKKILSIFLLVGTIGIVPSLGANAQTYQPIQLTAAEYQQLHQFADDMPTKYGRALQTWIEGLEARAQSSAKTKTTDKPSVKTK